MQELELVVGDVRLRELAEAGVDAVHGLALGDDAPHGRGARVEPRARVRIQRDRLVRTPRTGDVRQRERAGDELHAPATFFSNAAKNSSVSLSADDRTRRSPICARRPPTWACAV